MTNGSTPMRLCYDPYKKHYEAVLNMGKERDEFGAKSPIHTTSSDYTALPHIRVLTYNTIQDLYYSLDNKAKTIEIWITNLTNDILDQQLSEDEQCILKLSRKVEELKKRIHFMMQNAELLKNFLLDAFFRYKNEYKLIMDGDEECVNLVHNLARKLRKNEPPKLDSVEKHYTLAEIVCLGEKYLETCDLLISSFLPNIDNFPENSQVETETEPSNDSPKRPAECSTIAEVDKKIRISSEPNLQNQKE